jgi:hypothetical protein
MWSAICIIQCGWIDGRDSPENIAKARELWRALEPHTQGYYINTDTPHDERRLRQTYGGNYARLAQLKQRYDAANLFRLDANIRPVHASPATG